MNYISQTIQLYNQYHLKVLNFLLLTVVFISTFSHTISKKIIITTFILSFYKQTTWDQLKWYLRQPLIIVLLITFVYMSISLIWTPDFNQGRGIVENYIYYFLIPITIFSLIPNQKLIPYLIKTFIFSMFVNEVISYGIIFHIWGEMDSLGFPTPFVHHTIYSIFVAIALLLIGYQIAHSNNRLQQFLYLLFLVTMSGNLIISGGRNGQVTLLLTILVLALLSFRHSYKKSLLLLGSPILLFVLAFFLYGQFQERAIHIYTDAKQVFEDKNFETSFGNRLFSYFIAEKYVQDYNYFIGEGAGSIKTTKNALLDKYFKNVPHSNYIYTHFHQYYVSTLVQYGVIGLILLIMMFYFYYEIPIHNPEIQFLKKTLLLIMIFSNLADGMLFFRITMIIFAIFIGITIAQHRIETLEKTS